MQAVLKASSAPGAEVREVKVPQFGRSDVLVKVKVASICGTDLHIYECTDGRSGGSILL
jgi:threonine 3-dehydrogenase